MAMDWAEARFTANSNQMAALTLQKQDLAVQLAQQQAALETSAYPGATQNMIDGIAAEVTATDAKIAAVFADVAPLRAAVLDVVAVPVREAEAKYDAALKRSATAPGGKAAMDRVRELLAAYPDKKTAGKSGVRQPPSLTAPQLQVQGASAGAAPAPAACLALGTFVCCVTTKASWRSTTNTTLMG